MADYTWLHRRGHELLRSNLTPEQLASYRANYSFIVKGSKSGNSYRIREGGTLNIDVLDKRGRRVGLMCFMPKGNLVSGDVMLAQKLALETDERAALRVANVFEIGEDPAYDGPIGRPAFATGVSRAFLALQSLYWFAFACALLNLISFLVR